MKSLQALKMYSVQLVSAAKEDSECVQRPIQSRPRRHPSLRREAPSAFIRDLYTEPIRTRLHRVQCPTALPAGRPTVPRRVCGGYLVTRNGSTMRTPSSSAIPFCMSSDHKMSQPASSAEDTIMAS